MAALDVLDTDPPATGNPFLSMDNVIITAHYGGANQYYTERAMEIFLDNLQRYRSGESMRNVVDKRMQIMRLLGVAMLPTTILVDTSGVVRMFHVGYKPGFEKELEEKIHELLPNGQGQ